MPPIRLSLSDGRSIPNFGLGIWQIPAAETAGVVATAIDLGYRLIDGAFIYGNEEGLGEGLRQAKTPRDEVFVTTKVWNSEQGYDKTRRAVEGSLKRIGVAVLDLCLIHWPCPTKGQYVDTWKALIQAQNDGQIRSIGVSNFNTDHLDRLIGETGVAPAVNQIEINPGLQQPKLRADCAERGIVVQSWSPLGKGASFDSPIMQAISTRLGCSPAEVVLRWHVELGLSVIPRSTKPANLRTNLGALELSLTPDDMAAIAQLDTGTRTGPDPATFEEG